MPGSVHQLRIDGFVFLSPAKIQAPGNNIRGVFYVVLVVQASAGANFGASRLYVYNKLRGTDVDRLIMAWITYLLLNSVSNLLLIFSAKVEKNELRLKP